MNYFRFTPESGHLVNDLGEKFLAKKYFRENYFRGKSRGAGPILADAPLGGVPNCPFAWLGSHGAESIELPDAAACWLARAGDTLTGTITAGLSMA